MSGPSAAKSYFCLHCSSKARGDNWENLWYGGGLRVEGRMEDEEGGGQRSQSYANYRKIIIRFVTAVLYINATEQTF